jgi:ribonuclease HI
MAKKKKYYVVWEGNRPGIYDSWTACQLQIKGYPNARYKSFSSWEEAQRALGDSAHEHIKPASGRSKKRPASDPMREGVVWDSVAVDAACSGNPGPMEYQGVQTSDGALLFHQRFPLGTNNIGEFLAIVHALARLAQEGRPDKPIYTDSKIALGWVKKKTCKSKLPRDRRTEKLYQVIRRAETWLRENTYENPILKWETERWGEIPADFGRK